MKKFSYFLAIAIALLCVFTLGACKKDNKINVYTRDTTSGTRDGFFTGIGFSEAKEDNNVLIEGYIEVKSNGEMIQSVKNDLYGIGYISLSSLMNSGVKGLKYEGVDPTEANVLNSSYKLTRNFNYCIRSSFENEKKETIVQAFIKYMNTVEGKATIKEHGGIIETTDEDQSWTEIKELYPMCNDDNSNITINVGGSTSVKGIVQTLLLEFSAKFGNFKYNYNPTGSSDAYKRTNGSEKDGVNACDIAFASREFNSNEEMDNNLKGRMCLDAIVVIVNSKNSLTDINADILKAIYKGETTNWEILK